MNREEKPNPGQAIWVVTTEPGGFGYKQAVRRNWCELFSGKDLITYNMDLLNSKNNEVLKEEDRIYINRSHIFLSKSEAMSFHESIMKFVRMHNDGEKIHYSSELKELKHYKNTTAGLRSVDKNPKEVTKERIDMNAFQL